MKKSSLLALMVLVSATGLSAKESDADKDNNNDQAAASSTDQQEKKADDQDKVICRSERATGSLLRVNRICHTKAEWNEIAQRTNRTIDNLNRTQNLGSDTGSANGSNNAAGF